jgi:hypothetical protein
MGKNSGCIIPMIGIIVQTYRRISKKQHKLLIGQSLSCLDTTFELAEQIIAETSELHESIIAPCGHIRR